MPRTLLERLAAKSADGVLDTLEENDQTKVDCETTLCGGEEEKVPRSWLMQVCILARKVGSMDIHRQEWMPQFIGGVPSF